VLQEGEHVELQVMHTAATFTTLAPCLVNPQQTHAISPPSIDICIQSVHPQQTHAHIQSVQPYKGPH